jgi:hypothetical protein
MQRYILLLIRKPIGDSVGRDFGGHDWVREDDERKELEGLLPIYFHLNVTHAGNFITGIISYLTTYISTSNSYVTTRTKLSTRNVCVLGARHACFDDTLV